MRFESKTKRFNLNYSFEQSIKAFKKRYGKSRRFSDPVFVYRLSL